MVNEAIEAVVNSTTAFAKIISRNDAGETGGHQAGIYLPKNSVPIAFPTLFEKGANHERAVEVEWPDHAFTKATFKYYGTGTRNEYRITTLGKHLLSEHLFVMAKMSDEKYKAFMIGDKDDIKKFLLTFNLRADHIGLINVPNNSVADIFGNVNAPATDIIGVKEALSNIKKTSSGEYFIRPAGRHILTIGRDLIKDKYAAVVELVKNSYDADATNVNITFSTIQKEIFFDGESETISGLRLTINDDGHGMDFSTVVNKWMVPSTNDKLERKISANGRVMQGRKGIGRFAASILGNELVLDTVDKNKGGTTLVLDWDEFEKQEFLSDVPILIEQYSSAKSSGTSLEIVGTAVELSSWTSNEISSLIIELKKLNPPIEEFQIKEEFNVNLNFINFPVEHYENREIRIEPFPIVDLYHYRISGTVANGIASLKYENSLAGATQSEIFGIDIKLNFWEKYCGPLYFDLRVFDREPEAIQNLIDRGLHDFETGRTLGRRDTRRLLNDFNGIGIYRNGFRIRPYGDPGYDWLQLDALRVQDPSRQIGVNQIIGFIKVESEEVSHLEEKSARDGIKENEYYEALFHISRAVLNELAKRRHSYRIQSNKGRNRQSVGFMIDSLFDFSDLKQEVTNELDFIGAPETSQLKINELIVKKEIENNKIAEELKRKIAMYEGQVTLGKIVNVILHEGRKPIHYFNNQVPLLDSLIIEIKNGFQENLLDKIIIKAQKIKEQAQNLTALFAKIDPLSAKVRGRKKTFSIKKILDTVKELFQGELIGNNIGFIVNLENDINFIGWEQDFVIALTNLVENSLYWLTLSDKLPHTITINVSNVAGKLIIDYQDNGIGIAEQDLEDNMIFEPGYSTKIDGSGLGLAISGEAMERNDCKLKAEYSEKGVHFIIEQIK